VSEDRLDLSSDPEFISGDPNIRSLTALPVTFTPR
jgi:hypothetical protein